MLKIDSTFRIIFRNGKITIGNFGRAESSGVNLKFKMEIFNEIRIPFLDQYFT